MHHTVQRDNTCLLIWQVRSFWNLLLADVPRGTRSRPWYVLPNTVRNRITALGAQVEVTGDFTRPYRHVACLSCPPEHPVPCARKNTAQQKAAIAFTCTQCMCRVATWPAHAMKRPCSSAL